jgi:dolichol-phosphate mannosyltransferase
VTVYPDNAVEAIVASEVGADSPATSTPDLSVVIPAMDEKENLDLLLPALKEVIAGLGINAEIIVADGGSSDGTAEAAASRGARVVQQVERGYGGALLAGFEASRAPYVITMDADLSHRPVVLEELWRNRHEGEVVIASRYAPGGEAGVGGLRRLLSRILNTTYSRVLSLPVKDLSSGFRLYRRNVLRGIPVQSRDFDVLEEILIRIHADGWRIHEVPFRYMSRGSGESHVRLLKFGWAYLKTLIRMWQLRNSVASADYDYRAFDSPIWLQRYWQRKRHEIVLDFVRGQGDVLDVGCGTSRIVVDLPAAVGLDIAYRKLRWLRRLHPRVIQATCTTLPFPDGSFDAVINSEVIEHVADDAGILREMHRILRPGGTLILGTPDYARRLWLVLEWIYGKIMPGAYAHEHITRFTRRTLHQRLVESGFEVLDCRYVGYCEMIFKARKR